MAFAKSNLTLYYMDLRGRAELSRLVLAAGDKKYKDVRFKDHDDWKENYKQLSPFGQCPYIDIDGEIHGQSAAIAKYLARELDLCGKDSFEELRIDEIIYLGHDLNFQYYTMFYESDKAEKAKKETKFYADELPQFLRHFERMLKENGTGYFVGKSLTLADLAVFDALEMHIQQNKDLLKDFPDLAKHRETVLQNPGVAEHVKTRPPSSM